MSETPKRRWLSFSIREAGLLVLASGLALAWHRDRQALLAERQMWAPVRQAVEFLRVPPPAPTTRSANDPFGIGPDKPESNMPPGPLDFDSLVLKQANAEGFRLEFFSAGVSAA